jgi:hypothetical protein
VVLIKHCRLHYFCGSVDDVRSFFEAKIIELKLGLRVQRKGGAKGGQQPSRRQSPPGGNDKLSRRQSNDKQQGKHQVASVATEEMSLPSLKLDQLKFRDENALEDHDYDGVFNVHDR